MTGIKIKAHKRAPKTYKQPKGLSLDATGLLAHMREHQSTDNTYVWGVKATAEFFGISNRKRIMDAYDELENANIVTRIDVPKDATQRQPPRVVRLKPCSQIYTVQTTINTRRNASDGANTSSKAVSAGEHTSTVPIDKAHRQSTTDSPITHSVLVSADKHGSRRRERAIVEAELKKARASLKQWEEWERAKHPKAAEYVENARRSIEELTAELGGLQ